MCSFVTVQDWEQQLGPLLKENLKSSECSESIKYEHDYDYEYRV